MTPLSTAACSRAGALKVRGVGLAWGSGAPVAEARRADSHCAHAAVARKRSPARSCMMMSDPPPPPLAPVGARSAPCTKRLDQRKAHDGFDNDIPTTKRQRARYRRGHMHRRPPPGRAAPTPSAPSAQREAATGLPQAPGRAVRPCHRRRARIARGGDLGSQRLPCPAQRARSALGAERGARSARRRSGSPHVPWRTAPTPPAPSA